MIQSCCKVHQLPIFQSLHDDITLPSLTVLDVDRGVDFTGEPFWQRAVQPPSFIYSAMMSSLHDSLALRAKSGGSERSTGRLLKERLQLTRLRGYPIDSGQTAFPVLPERFDFDHFVAVRETIPFHACRTVLLVKSSKLVLQHWLTVIHRALFTTHFETWGILFYLLTSKYSR